MLMGSIKMSGFGVAVRRVGGLRCAVWFIWGRLLVTCRCSRERQGKGCCWCWWSLRWGFSRGDVAIIVLVLHWASYLPASLVGRMILGVRFELFHAKTSHAKLVFHY